MQEKREKSHGKELPSCVTEFVRTVARTMRYRRKVREDVQTELSAHFEDELRGCEDPQEREQKARRLIEEFGDAGLLGVLCRRAKKRCRPLWVRAFVRTLQAMGVFLLVFIPYMGWFIRGKPNPTIDYLPQLNALHRPSAPIKDDAWPYYERAMRLAVEPNEVVKQVSWLKSFDLPGRPLTAHEYKMLEGWITINSPAWSQLELAASRRECYRVYRTLRDDPLIMSADRDPPLSNLKWLTFLGRCKARLALERGRIDESLDYCLTLLRTGAHWQRNALLIGQLLGMAITGCANQDMLYIVGVEEFSPAQLAELHTEITSAYPDEYPSADFEGERLVMLDTVQRVFTSGGLGGGHYLVGAYTELKISDTPVSWPRKATIRLLDVAASMIHARRNQTIVKVNEWYDRMNRLAKLSPYERRERQIASMIESMGWVERLRYAWIRYLTQDEQRVSKIAFRARADYEALLTVIAVKRYRLQEGSYPPDMETLIQVGYLRKVPSDPYSAGPLVYRATDNDFILYSLGPNFADDGGEPGRDEEGRPKRWGVNGDMVFWPVIP